MVYLTRALGIQPLSGSHLLTVNCQVGVALEVTQNTQGQFHTYKGVTNSQNGCTLVTV